MGFGGLASVQLVRGLYCVWALVVCSDAMVERMK
jgi:hypothetical protein